MSNVQISLFVRLHMQHNAQTLAGLEGQKVQELFSYLLLYRDRSHSREQLATLLWGSFPDAQAKQYLRKALWQLQTALDLPDVDPLLLIDNEWVQINPASRYWLDIAVFEEMCAGVRGIPGATLEPQQAYALRQAAQLYRGNLLVGWYTDWCLFERERLLQLYLVLLDKLIDYHEAHAEYEVGIHYAMESLRYEPARERTHRRLMRLQYLAGDRTTALHQYERCVAALKEELDVPPSRPTVTLYEQIRRDQVLLPTAPQRPDATPEAKQISEILQGLYQLQGVLADAQHQLQQEIQIVQQSIKELV